MTRWWRASGSARVRCASRRIDSDDDFARCFTRKIAHTVADPAEIEEEVRYLLRVLGS